MWRQLLVTAVTISTNVDANGDKDED